MTQISSDNQLQLESRQEMVKRALKYSRQQGGKKRKQSDDRWALASIHSENISYQYNVSKWHGEVCHIRIILCFSWYQMLFMIANSFPIGLCYQLFLHLYGHRVHDALFCNMHENYAPEQIWIMGNGLGFFFRHIITQFHNLTNTVNRWTLARNGIYLGNNQVMMSNVAIWQWCLQITDLANLDC